MAEQQNVTDPYSMSLDDLKKLALQEATAAASTDKADEKNQPRDEQGRFKPAAEDHEDDDNEDEDDNTPTRVIVRRVVDIGDGVEPEVFEAEGADKAEALELLADRIAEAKKHATKKIREQEAVIRKNKEAEAPKARTFSEDEEYVYSQELMNKPTQAFSKIFKDMVGMDITQFKTYADKVNALESGKSRNEAITTFILSHPLYEDSDHNRDVMTLAMQGKQVTAETLSKAYETMVSKGLLELKSSEQGSEQDANDRKQGITAEGSAKGSSQGTKKSSSLSKNRNAVQSKSNEPSQDDLYNMPLDKLKQLGNRELANR